MKVKVKEAEDKQKFQVEDAVIFSKNNIFKLIFLDEEVEIGESSEGEFFLKKIKKKVKGEYTLSPRRYKLLIQQMRETLEKYEDEFGEISANASEEEENVKIEEHYT